MKKNYIIKSILLLTTVLVMSCNDNPTKNLELKYTVINIEDCEYIQYTSAMEYYEMTHKGNCKNPIHCYNK